MKGFVWKQGMERMCGTQAQLGRGSSAQSGAEQGRRSCLLRRDERRLC